MSLLVGCDPEMFVKQGGIFKSAFDLIPGTKAAPFKVSKGAVQVDGMALEFNIDPASSEDEFVGNIGEVVNQLRSMVPDYEVVASPVAKFDPAYFEDQPLLAKELGCEPDYNAYTADVNHKPHTDKPMRTAAGHVHVGWTQGAAPMSYDHAMECIKVVKLMDLFLGIPSLFYDADTERRELYGKAGAFRPKSYGVEYRTLSNMWLNDEKLSRWVFRATAAALEAHKAGVVPPEGIEGVINTSNLEAAKELCERFNLEIPNV